MAVPWYSIVQAGSGLVTGLVNPPLVLVVLIHHKVDPYCL